MSRLPSEMIEAAAKVLWSKYSDKRSSAWEDVYNKPAWRVDAIDVLDAAQAAMHIRALKSESRE